MEGVITMGNMALEFIQKLHADGYLAADFKLFGVPQTEQDAEIWMAQYQSIRNYLN